jgi:hypothetical protein
MLEVGEAKLLKAGGQKREQKRGQKRTGNLAEGESSPAKDK